MRPHRSRTQLTIGRASSMADSPPYDDNVGRAVGVVCRRSPDPLGDRRGDSGRRSMDGRRAVHRGGEVSWAVVGRERGPRSLSGASLHAAST